jgi:hypothetical protein
MLVPDKRSLPEISSCAHVASLREGMPAPDETPRLADLLELKGFYGDPLLADQAIF